MKFNDISFPHPVLGNGDSIRSKFSFPDPEIISEIDTYSIKVICLHDNVALAELTREGQAEFYCEATCSNTLFRKIYKSNSGEIKFEIPKKHVKGRGYFTCALAAKNSIQNYQNIKFHPDFSGYSFDLDEGDILAIFGEFSFNADINYERLKAVSSFMEVVENTDENVDYTNVDLNKSKIEVQLPSKDYKLFSNDIISKELDFAPIFHSSIVMNALLIALYNIENYKDKLWADAIMYRLEKDSQFIGISIEDKVKIPEIAQGLLGNPFHRLIAGLQKITLSKNEIEE